MENNRLKKIDISQEMKSSFLDYAMSVIVSRAIPDVRDGLKPVHRRILYSMTDLGITSDSQTKKSARIVGDVIGRFHPHGDTAVYDAMVRMAQDFSYRYPLVKGQGNFGSIDGDGAAAMRYTEAKMSKLSMELIRDIKKDTVDFMDNYDSNEREPSVLPSRYPNFLINGGSGIAVGMATNVPPHNLGEVIDATLAMIDYPEISVMELMENYIFGPDFPTGSYILGRAGIKKAYETGKGSIIQRSRVKIEELASGKKRIVVYEIPYMVNKASLVEKIANLVKDKVIDGITDLRDESNKDGIAIVIELKKGVQEEVLLNQLYRLTPLQTSFGVNMLALVHGKPEVMGLKDVLQNYIEHQQEIIVRRSKFDLQKALDRAHILEGFKIALDFIDEIIAIIRRSRGSDSQLCAELMERFDLSEIQAKAILDMRLKRLSALEKDKIEDEYQQLLSKITDLRDIIQNNDRVLTIIKDELTEIKERFGDPRRSEIIDYIGDFEDEDLIPVEDIAVTLTMNGYIKRTNVDIFKVQNRGGKGVKGVGMYDDDIVDTLLTMSTHDYLLLFTNTGRVYRLKGYELPNASRTGKGLPIVNLIKLEPEEKIASMVAINPDEFSEEGYLVFATTNGLCKRSSIDLFKSINRNGKIAITLLENDSLLSVRKTKGDDHLIFASNQGKVVCIDENSIRPSGRSSRGVIAMKVNQGKVIGFAIASSGQYLLTITEKGYGKKTKLSEYRVMNRNTQGVYSFTINDKVGHPADIRVINGDEDILIISNEGIIIRIETESISVFSRSAMGVKLMNLGEDEIVSKVAIVEKEELEEELDD